MDIAEFISARLGEDQAVAREAASALPGDEGYAWTAVHRYSETHPAAGESFVVDTSSELVANAASARSYDRAVADHIARYDPARALREVDSLREQAETAAHLAAYGDKPVSIIGETMQMRIAAIWNDHADYNPDWSI